MQVKELETRTLPPEILAYRSDGARRLGESGLPHKKTEHWMKFDISGLLETSFLEADKSSLSDMNDEFPPLDEEAQRIFLINGYPLLTGEESQKLFEDFEIGGLSHEIGKVGDPQGTFFYNLNSSKVREPLVIKVRKGSQPKTLQLVQVTTAEKEDFLASPRIVIIVEEGAELKLIQSFESQQGASGFNNSVTEIQVGKNSVLNHLILTDRGRETTVFNNLFVNQRSGSRYTSHSLVADTTMSRNEYQIYQKEENCETAVNVLYLGQGEEIHNSDITIHHEAPHCSSRTLARAIAGAEAQGVFRGMAMIYEGAQKSDARQQFKTILLGDKAQVNMEPHLEIWADDVKCAHGATVGQLDRQQLFYLQTRGYTPQEARQILLEAFAAEITESIAMESAGLKVKERIMTLMDGLHE